MKQKWTKYEDESFQLFIYTIWKQKLYQYDWLSIERGVSISSTRLDTVMLGDLS